MKYIEKMPEPEGFIQWKEQEKERIGSVLGVKNAGRSLWDLLPSSPPTSSDEGISYYSKQDLKKYLLEEQGWLCCYCNRVFKRTDLSPEDGDETNPGHLAEDPLDIEHIRPKSAHPELTLEYANLAISCAGGRRKPSRLQTCNARKGDKLIGITPHDPDCEQRIVFTLNGEAIAKDENDCEAHNTIDVLGLNLFTMERKKIINGSIYQVSDQMTYDEFTNPGVKPLISKEKAQSLVRKLSKKDDTGRYKPFCSAVISVLKSEIIDR